MAQIIHVGALDTPKVISRVGSMQNLVDHVLQPIVGNYFRNSAQDYTVLDFLSARSQRQLDADSTRLRALGEAEAIRATGNAKAEACHAGVESLGAQGYTVMQPMQIVGERNVRIVPDVAVNGATGSTGLVDGLLGVMLRGQNNGQATTQKSEGGAS